MEEESESEEHFSFQDYVNLSGPACDSAMTRLVVEHHAEPISRRNFHETLCRDFMVEVEVEGQLEFVFFEVLSHPDNPLVSVKVIGDHAAALAKGFSLLWPSDVGPSWFLGLAA